MFNQNDAWLTLISLAEPNENTPSSIDWSVINPKRDIDHFLLFFTDYGSIFSTTVTKDYSPKDVQPISTLADLQLFEKELLTRSQSLLKSGFYPPSIHSRLESSHQEDLEIVKKVLPLSEAERQVFYKKFSSNAFESLRQAWQRYSKWELDPLSAAIFNQGGYSLADAKAVAKTLE